MSECIAQRGFGRRGATGLASLGSCKKFPPCLIEPMLAGSTMDPLLARAKPINNSDRISVTAYLRRGKNCCTVAAERERTENMCEK